MMNRNFRVIFVAVIAALLGILTLVSAQSDEVVVEAGDSVTLGLAAGLSGEGIAPLGLDIQRGAELALLDRPTVTVGGVEFPVVLDVQDSLCSAEGGQTVANRFTADESVVGVVGHMCSGSCFAGAPIYDAAGYTTISPSCTNPSLTLRGFTSFNRVVPSDGVQGVVAADYIFNDLMLTRVATIHDGSPYGEGLVSVMSTRFAELGGEIVSADAVTVGDTDFRALLEEIASNDPQLIYFGGFPAEAARLIQQRADAGMEDVLFMGADGFLGTEVVELAGDAAEGVYASAPISSSSEALDAFLVRYVEVYGEEPPAPFHANAYDATNIFLDAIEAVGQLDDSGNLVISRSALADYVRGLTDYEGLVGTLTANGEGETFSPEQSIIGMSQVIDGAFAQVAVFGGQMEEDMMDDDMAMDMDMEIMSGMVSFDRGDGVFAASLPDGWVATVDPVDGFLFATSEAVLALGMESEEAPELPAGEVYGQILDILPTETVAFMGATPADVLTTLVPFLSGEDGPAFTMGTPENFAGDPPAGGMVVGTITDNDVTLDVGIYVVAGDAGLVLVLATAGEGELAGAADALMEMLLTVSFTPAG